MKKLLVMFVVLGMAGLANGAGVMNINVNDQAWDGSSSVLPSDLIQLSLVDTEGSVSGGPSVLGISISDGDLVGASGLTTAVGWILNTSSIAASGGGLIASLNASSFNTPATEVYEIEFHVPNLAASSTITVSITGGSYETAAVDFSPSGGTAGLAEIHVAPEPVTMSLLGLGGLALLRRRRA